MGSRYETSRADTRLAPLRHMWAWMVAGRAVRHQGIAATWETMPAWRRGLYRAEILMTSAIGLVVMAQAVKTTGASAHACEELTIPALTQTDYDVAVPAVPTDVPQSVALGEYESGTDDGTVWGQVTQYAGLLGYGDLTEQQKYGIVSQTLDAAGLTWDQAENLSSAYRPTLLSPAAMQQGLEALGAERAQAPAPTTPEPSTIQPSGGQSTGRPAGMGESAGNHPNAPHVHRETENEWVIGVPFSKAEIEVDGVAVLGSLVAAAGLGAYAVTQRRRRRC